MNTDLHVPPHSETAEQSVLGAMLLDATCIDDVRQRLSSQSFYNLSYGRIFAAILSVHDRRQAVDAVVVAEELERRKQLADIGGPMVLAEILESVPHAAHAAHYTDIVHRLHLRRQIIAGLREQLSKAFEGAEPEVLAANLTKLAESAQVGVVGETTWTAAQSLDALEQFERDLESGKILVVPTGIHGIDAKIDIGERQGVRQGGFQGGDLVILGARPSIGKTAFATQLALHCAENVGHSVAFSLEMKQRRVAKRIVRDMDRGRFRQMPFLINSKLRSMQDIITEIRVLVKRHGVKIAVVDHIGLVHPPNQRIDRRLQVADMSRAFKEAAEELDIPILVLSQLSRRSEQHGRRPSLADLAESGALEQDADIVMLLHRETRSDAESEVILAKNRDGETGLVKLTFDTARSRLTEKNAFDAEGF